VDYKDFAQAVNLIGSGGFNTPITYLPFTLGWDGNWLGDTSSSKLGAAFNFHLRGLLGDEQQFADKRFKGRPGYAYLRGSASHSETSAGHWVLSARASWQLAGQALISNEQFALGGADTVRGYLESAAMGDKGAALSLEAATPNFAKQLSDTLQDLHLLAFLDGGTVRVIDPITAVDHYYLGSAGMGLRLKGPKGASAALDWALVLKESGNAKKGDSRVHVRLGYEW
jgi:hemolysin activation/secretion protein